MEYVIKSSDDCYLRDTLVDEDGDCYEEWWVGKQSDATRYTREDAQDLVAGLSTTARVVKIKSKDEWNW